ncbi:MAG: membrane dipeptidase [Deltaproteobacteria bacterium]|nr:membrane dipeptidase [Deltaproteobacteria bacterium]
MKIDYRDWRQDPDTWALTLGVSRTAIDLYLDCDVIDLHIEPFLWHRLVGYDMFARHGSGLFNGGFYSQTDLPRIREAQITGATWVITTNPARTAEGRAETFTRNLDELVGELSRVPDEVAVVRNTREYRAARARGVHGAFLGIQGGNALDHSLDALDRLRDDLILRITLVHLTSSRLGVTNSPASILAGDNLGLSDFGRDYVRRLNEKKVFVDLAHIARKAFFDALEVHDKSQPVLVTHTGVTGVTPHWRNVDDEQIRAVADLGGVVGVMYQSSFLGDPTWRGQRLSIVRHLEHIANVAGDDVPALGSDWDGMIVTPRDMPTCLELPRLVQTMLDREWTHSRIRKVLGANFLNTVERLRG